MAILRTVPSECGDCSSYLGIDPVCDTCHQPIMEGDTVIQTFVGVVKFDTLLNEMGIDESVYSLIHTSCVKSS